MSTVLHALLDTYHIHMGIIRLKVTALISIYLFFAQGEQYTSVCGKMASSTYLRYASDQGMFVGGLQVAAKQQCEECHNECQANRGHVLGYVTPWNGRGYDVAKAERGRLTHVSPVWYQLKASSGSPVLLGSHDVDKGWIADVRGQANQVPKL
jgi:hypothetical protein